MREVKISLDVDTLLIFEEIAEILFSKSSNPIFSAMKQAVQEWIERKKKDPLIRQVFVRKQILD